MSVRYCKSDLFDYSLLYSYKTNSAKVSWLEVNPKLDQKVFLKMQLNLNSFIFHFSYLAKVLVLGLFYLLTGFQSCGSKTCDIPKLLAQCCQHFARKECRCE